MRILKAKPITLGWNTRKKFRRVATFSNFFRKQKESLTIYVCVKFSLSGIPCAKGLCLLEYVDRLDVSYFQV